MGYDRSDMAFHFGELRNFAKRTRICPEPNVFNGVISPINGLLNWQLGLFHPYNWSYFTLLITGRGDF